MKITPELVEHVADLARLKLSGDEQKRMEIQLGDILAYIGLLDELDTSGVSPTSHVIEVFNVFRDDEVRPSFPVEKSLANAPDRSGTAFKVPRIIED
ncbi:MAG: Asp-tRNA(Asn)/Glu-tRNA(Gln) amidotransferase subunit GatC [Deltaproteobacteria bacterium]|nr:Asp-tRNA(Asn)/Glu-tRNA(Gln) amidotransferase subunit GatC [Deltaproteobacteria bacterium]